MIKDTVIIDLTDELLPLRDLMVSHHRVYGEEQLKHTVERLIETIAYGIDLEYGLTNLSVALADSIFADALDEDKLSEIRYRIYSVGAKIYKKVNELYGYVNGYFPYTYKDLLLCSELVLVRSPMVEYYLKLKTGPFRNPIP